MMTNSTPGYSVDGLEHGIERCKINIASLEKAIEGERETIKNYRFMLDEIDRADREKSAAEAGLNSNIHVEVAADDRTD